MAKKDIEAEEALKNAKIDLLLNFPFWGVLAAKLRYIESKRINTLATDGKHFFYNPDFVKNLPHKKRVFGVAHEIGHCTGAHFIRKEKRDHDYWNMATDYVINYDLVHEEYFDSRGKKHIGIGEIDPDWLYKEEYGGMTAEDIYEDLLKNKSPKLPTLDTHLSAGDESNSKDIDEDLPLEDMPTITEEELEKNMNEFQQEVIKTASVMDSGSIPGSIRKLIDDLEDPKKNWKELLRSTIESAFKSETDWLNPHRRSWSQGYLMPGPAPAIAVDISVAIDTSGSMSEEQLRDILSELQGIMQQFKTYKIKMWCFDGKVHEESYIEITEADNFDMATYELHGFGGTNFGANWKFMKKREIKSDRFIMLTDGYCDFEGCDPDYIKTLWVIHSRYGDFDAPFGNVVKYEEAA